MSGPAPQRQRVDDGASGLSTNEHYARKHEIPEEVNNAIPSVAMRVRQAMGQGSNNRTFGRTESSPAVFGPFGGGSASATTPVYLTDAEAQAHAWEAIQRESLRARELKPFASNESIGITEDRLGLSPRRGAARVPSPDRLQGRRLRFGEHGEVVELMNGESSSSAFGSAAERANSLAPSNAMVPGKKRGAEDEATEGANADVDGFDDTATEVDEDEHLGFDTPGMSTGGHSGSSTLNDDFPSVFQSPAISQPELFGAAGTGQPAQVAKGGVMGPPAAMPTVRTGFGRTTKGLPGRKLVKTQSAPVMFGQWSMDVDMPPQADGEAQQEDGFSVSEWSKEAF